MAAKTPRKKKGKRKRKMRLSLRQSKVNMTDDKYSDSLGWSTDVGRTLGDAPKPTGPETIKIQKIAQIIEILNFILIVSDEEHGI